MTARLPGLDSKALMPGRIPAEQVTLHRAVHAAFYSPHVVGLRTLAAERGAVPRVLDLRDAVTPYVADEKAAGAVVRRIAGKAATGDRDPRTLRTEYVAMIVAAEDKAAAAEVVAEALCGPLREVGWLDAYAERMAAERKTFDHRPLVSVAARGATTHYLATLRMTPDQRTDLEDAAKPASLVVIDLPIRDNAQAQAIVAEALSLRGLAPPIEAPPTKETINAR